MNPYWCSWKIAFVSS